MLSAIAIDARSLAATRITLAILVLVELFDRWPLVDVFYSDASPYPITNIHSQLHRLACAHAWSGASAYVKALFVVHAAAAGALALGYRTRTAALATWYLYWSLTLRNCSVAYITDRYLHFFLLLLAFLPCARVWSADARGAGDALPPPTASLATALARLQLVWIYIDAGGGKLLDADGAWALGAPVPALEPMLLHTRVGRTVRAILGPLVRPFSASVAWVELLVPLIALLAAARGAPRVQAACAATMVGLHAGIGLCVNNAAILSTVASAVWLLFCPAEIWDAIGATRPPPPKAPPSPPRVRRVTAASAVLGAFAAAVVVYQLPLDLAQTCGVDEASAGGALLWSNLLNNRWNVFTSLETHVTWYTAPARLADGSVVDLWARGAPVSWDVPAAAARGGRWKSFPALVETGADGARLWEHLCREWNDAAPTAARRVAHFRFYLLAADLLYDGDDGAAPRYSAVRKRMLGAHECA